MKIYQNKNTVWRLAIILTMLFVFAQTATAQQLKPKEIVYSRLPTDLNQSPTGANSPTIWAVGQDGVNDRQLTTGMEPRISDDGRYLLFRRIIAAPGDVYHYNPYAAQAQGQLWVRDLANNSETMIFDFSTGNRRLIGYYFSPESNQGNYQIILDYGSLIYKMNLDGTGAIALEYYFGTGFPREGDYFPVLRRGDSRLVTATSIGCSSGNTGCGLVTRTLGSELPQNVPNTGEGDNNPSWSNDNQFIGFATIDGSRNYIYESSYYPYFFRRISKIKPDGTSKTPLFDLPDANYLSSNGIAFGTIWTEDNSKIIAAARIGGVAGLYAFNTDGSGTYTRIPISNGNAPDFVGGSVQPREEQQVVSIGGGVSSSGNYSLVDTIGEVVAGETSTGGSYNLQSGFWAFAAPNKTLFDFDGDGKADISVFRPSNGAWYLQQSQAGFTGVLFGQNGDKITPADYDGDGKADIAVFRAGTWYLQRSQLGFTGIAFGAATDIPVPADYDGDGKAEVAVYRPSSGAWYIYNLATNQFYTVFFGASEDKPVAADYDGDGKADVAVFRPSSGTWYIQQSQLGFKGLAFGAPTDVPVPGDYDGDGKSDIGVFRPGNGVWYLQRSQAGFTGVAFGTGTDIPAAADYDGDGKTDIAVFRPASGTWYLLQSTVGFAGIAFGASGDKPAPSAFIP